MSGIKSEVKNEETTSESSGKRFMQACLHFVGGVATAGVERLDRINHSIEHAVIGANQVAGPVESEALRSEAQEALGQGLRGTRYNTGGGVEALHEPCTSDAPGSIYYPKQIRFSASQ